jgi:hypothetical protein
VARVLGLATPESIPFVKYFGRASVIESVAEESILFKESYNTYPMGDADLARTELGRTYHFQKSGSWALLGNFV